MQSLKQEKNAVQLPSHTGPDPHAVPNHLDSPDFLNEKKDSKDLEKVVGGEDEQLVAVLRLKNVE